MKALILLIILSIPTFAQISVDQGFIDSSNKAFIEVKALRELETARKSEIEAKDALAASQSLLIASLNQGITARDTQILALSKLKCDSTTFLWGIIKKKSCK